MLVTSTGIAFPSFITCALVSLWTSAPQDVATMIAKCHAEILVSHKVMAFGGQLLFGKKTKNRWDI